MMVPVGMLTYLILGMTYAFAAAVQPGPLQTYLISQTLSHGWRRTLPAAFCPLISDGPVIVLVLLVLSRVPVWLAQGLRLAGGVFVLYLAWGALKAWRGYDARDMAPAPSSLLRAALVNVLNPNPYISWSLVLGPLLLKAWRAGARQRRGFAGGLLRHHGSQPGGHHRALCRRPESGPAGDAGADRVVVGGAGVFWLLSAVVGMAGLAAKAATL